MKHIFTLSIKILIAYSHQNEIQEFLNQIENFDSLKSFQYKHINIDFCETGYTAFETAFNMANALNNKAYHLVLFAGLANSLNKIMQDGQVLNVINDLPYKIGFESQNEFQDAYQLNYLDKNKAPHQRGGFINMSSSYFNVFLPYMKTASLTTNILGGNEATLQEKISRYPIHIETLNGVAFQYACLLKRIPFYQIRVVERNLFLKTENKVLALDKLNNELKKIIDLL